VSHDWDQDVFSEIYTVDANAKCKDNDEPRLKMKYLGVQSTCYGEDVTFKKGVELFELNITNPKLWSALPKTPWKFYNGTCFENGYHDR